MNKTYYAILIFLLILPLSAIVSYYYTSGRIIGPMMPLVGYENAIITQVVFDNANSNTLLVTIKRLDDGTQAGKLTNFTTALIRNSTNDAIEKINLPNNELPVNEEITLKVNITKNLAPGNYTILLATIHGSAFKSSFIKP